MTAVTSRWYRDEDDLRAMQALLMAARAQTNDWRYPHVGDLNWSFFLVHSQLDPRTQVRLWHDTTGSLVAYCMVGVDPTLELQVLPDWTAQGIEEAALDWATALWQDLRQADPARWAGGLGISTRPDDGRRRTLLECYGFRPTEHVEVSLLCSLSDPPPGAQVAPAYTVRAVTGPAESTARAAAEHAVWGQWAAGEIDGADYAWLMTMPGYLRDLDVVAATPDGEIAAYVNGWLDPVNRVADLGPVGALPAHRRQGLTRAVLIECLRLAQAAGMDRAVLNTGAQNEPALALYRSLGFRVMTRWVQYWLG